MRWVFLLLLAVNIGFGVFVFVMDQAPNPDAQLIALQMNADKVRIVPPRPAPAPAPVTASTRAACVEWGGFGTGELRARRAPGSSRARRARAPSRSQRPRATGIHSAAAIAGGDGAQGCRAQETGVNEYFCLDPPVAVWISLGVFRSEGCDQIPAQLRQRACARRLSANANSA
jgi:hypothetical protein